GGERPGEWIERRQRGVQLTATAGQAGAEGFDQIVERLGRDARQHRIQQPEQLLLLDGQLGRRHRYLVPRFEVRTRPGDGQEVDELLADGALEHDAGLRPRLRDVIELLLDHQLDAYPGRRDAQGADGTDGDAAVRDLLVCEHSAGVGK